MEIFSIVDCCQELCLLILSGESSHRKLNIIYSRRIEKKLLKFRNDKFFSFLLWCQFTLPRHPNEKLQKKVFHSPKEKKRKRCEKEKFLEKVLKTLNNLVLVSRRLNLYHFVTSLKSHASPFFNIASSHIEENYYCHRLPLWRLLSTTTEGVFPLII